MLPRQRPVRKYFGILILTFSIMLILNQFGFVSPSHPFSFDDAENTVLTISMAGLVAGCYLIAGPLGGIVALASTVAARGNGCCNGPGPRKKEEEPLPEPPEPPESL